MKLDLFTLQVILGLVFLVNMLFSLVFLFARQHFRGVLLWIMAQLCLALAALAALLRPQIPPIFSIGVGNTLFFAAIVFYAHTSWLLRSRRRFPIWAYASVPIVFILFTLLIPAPTNLRVILFCLLISPISLAVFFLLVWKAKPEARFAGWITGFPFACVGIFNLARIPDAIISPNRAAAFMADGNVSSLVYVLAILVASLSLYGYFLLSSARFESRLLRKESLIRRQISRLRELNHTKDIFFSIIAHDLRGPVGGAARYVRKHLINSKTSVEEKETAVRTLAESLERTNKFLENLLWWARSQRNDAQPHRVVVNLAELAHEAMITVGSSGKEKQITINFNGNPMFVEVEPVSVRLIIQNLLSNAIKFSHRNSAVQLEAGYERGMAIVRVTDHGIGMEPAFVETLFKIDRKTSTHGTEGEYGTGLGLILCRSFADRNKSTLDIASQPGVGTVAELRIPLAPYPTVPVLT